jgi:hypothetical protein
MWLVGITAVQSTFGDGHPSTLSLTALFDIVDAAGGPLRGTRYAGTQAIRATTSQNKP